MSTLTKIFIILQLVFSLTLSVMVALWVGSQPKYKEQVEAQARMTMAAQAALAREEYISNARSNAVAQLTAALQADQNANKQRLLDSANALAAKERETADLNARINEIDATNRQYAATIQSLKDQYTTVSTQLTALQNDNLKQLRRSEELARINESVTTERDALLKSLSKTQEELKAVTNLYDDVKNHPAAGAGAGSAGGGSIVDGSVTPLVKTTVNAAVTKVDETNGKTSFALPLGKRDGMQNGQRLIISRNNSYIGDAIVVSTNVDALVAQVDILKRGETVHAGDIVSVQGK
jgi:hypothetical protein